MWDKLRAHHAQVSDRRFETLVDAPRAADFSARVDDMVLDYAKTNIDADGRALLFGLLDQAGVGAKRDAMFAGAPINETEGRAVLHTALRNLDGGAIVIDGVDVMPEIHATLDAMSEFAAAVRSGRFAGQGGKITDVINIGIGGSDLGPAMAAKALAPYHDGPRCHFVSNVDPADIADVLRQCDPTTRWSRMWARSLLPCQRPKIRPLLSVLIRPVYLVSRIGLVVAIPFGARLACH